MCGVSLCYRHGRSHNPEHELVFRRRQSPASQLLGTEPASKLKWSVLDILDHEPDKSDPRNVDKIKFKINWAGPFKHEWCTLKELGFNLENELVARYLANNRIDVGRLRLVHPTHDQVMQSKQAKQSKPARLPARPPARLFKQLSVLYFCVCSGTAPVKKPHHAPLNLT